MQNGLTYFHFDEINSTNSYLYDKMSVGEDVADTVVSASYQTAGRGMDKNSWESAEGQNLLFSIALNVSYLEAKNQFKISQAVAVAIVDTLQSIVNRPGLSVKWPNDIYFGDKKLCGMLIQNTVEGRMMGVSIIGIGLNVNQIEFSKRLPNPTSLKMITGEELNLHNLLEKLTANIKNAVESLENQSCFESLDKKYTDKLYRYRQWADYLYKNEVKSMIINGFDLFGRLLLTDKSGAEAVCDVKEIQFCLPSFPQDSEADA